MRKYELTVVTKVGTRGKWLRDTIRRNGGIIEDYYVEEDKRLAYPIGNEERADYHHLEVGLGGYVLDLVTALDRNNKVLRHLLVRHSGQTER